MTITHIVSLAFADSASKQERSDLYDAFLSLKSSCKREDGKPYIVELVGGKDNTSPEGFGKHYDHSYVVRFANVADRDYYLDVDPAHNEFKARAQKVMKDAFIFDFEH